MKKAELEKAKAEQEVSSQSFIPSIDSFFPGTYDLVEQPSHQN